METPAGPSADTQDAFTPTEGAAKLLEKVKEALEQRKIRYKLVFVVTMYFKSDDSGSQEDSKDFERGMQQMLGLPNINIITCELPTNRHARDYWIYDIMPKINKLCGSTEGRKLLILHCVGHGTVDSQRGLILEGGPVETTEATETSDPTDATLPAQITQYDQYLEWQLIDLLLISPDTPGSSGILDIAAVLDCCYAGSFDRMTKPKLGTNTFAANNRIVEVIAATDDKTKTTERALLDSKATFTRRFLSVMRTMVGHTSKPPVTLPRILSRLNSMKQSGTPPVIHRLLKGPASILLPVTSIQLPPPLDIGPSDPQALSTWRQPHQYIALEIHFPQEPDEVYTDELVRWFHHIQAEYELRVNGVFRTESTIIHLTISYEHLHLIYALQDSGLFTVRRITENLSSQNLIDNYIKPGNTTDDHLARG